MKTDLEKFPMPVETITNIMEYYVLYATEHIRDFNNKKGKQMFTISSPKKIYEKEVYKFIMLQFVRIKRIFIQSGKL